MRVHIDDNTFEAKKGETVIELAARNGIEIPHFCWHPGLSIAGACRMCYVEIGMPARGKDGQYERDETGNIVVKMIPKLQIACNTPVADEMVVKTKSERVKKGQEAVMEFLLLNHPLDCPVCDQSGECVLQDNSFDYGRDRSRFKEDKIVNPKKDIGKELLLYADRCIYCWRCVRFEQEISGTHGLAILNRGAHSEIDIVDGNPVDHELSLNLVDICPVGCFKSKDFLFKQRVWFLKNTDSICPGCSKGCNIRIDHNKNQVYRIRPRYNAEVNEWWMCDIGRMTYKWLYDRERVRVCSRKVPEGMHDIGTAQLMDFVSTELLEAKKRFVAVITPFASVEELLMVRKLIDLLEGKVVFLSPPYGKEIVFPKFKVSRDRTPNRKAVEQIFKGMVNDIDVVSGEDTVLFLDHSPENHLEEESVKKLKNVSNLLLFTPFTDHPLIGDAAYVAPATFWAEKSGSFINQDGVRQEFKRAVLPASGTETEFRILAGIYKRMAGVADNPDVKELAAQYIDGKVPVTS